MQRDTLKFMRILKRAGLTSGEIFHFIMFNEGDLDKYKESFYDYDMTKKQQKGGSNRSIKYNGQKYTFIKEKDDTGRYIFTLRQNIKKINADVCILVIIDLQYNYAYVENISNLEGCLKRGIITNKGGNELMKLLINYLYKIKDKYKLKYIQLRDNSTKYINGERIILKNLMYLTQGRTWYEKYGFIPCQLDTMDKIIFDKNDYKKKLKQWKLYVTKTIKDLMITEKKIKSIFLNYDERKAKLFFIKIVENENMLVRDFILMISKDVSLISMLNAFMIKVISKFKLDIAKSVCADINNSYDLVINGNVQMDIVY